MQLVSHGLAVQYSTARPCTPVNRVSVRDVINKNKLWISLRQLQREVGLIFALGLAADLLGLD